VRQIRTLLADDHPMVFEIVERLLTPACRIVAKVGDGLALIQVASRTKPDVIVTDISMPILNGIEAARRLRHSGCMSPIVFLTTHQDVDFIKACLDAGALAYVSKLRMNTDLWFAIQEALVGRGFVSPMAHSAVS